GSRLEQRALAGHHRPIQLERPRHRDDHVLTPEDDPLLEDLLVVGETTVVDAGVLGGAHASGDTGSTKTSMIPPQTAGLHENRSSVRSTRTRSGTPVSSTRCADSI